MVRCFVLHGFDLCCCNETRLLPKGVLVVAVSKTHMFVSIVWWLCSGTFGRVFQFNKGSFSLVMIILTRSINMFV